MKFVPQRLVRPAVVFLVSLAWLSFFIPWHGFADPDAFYHAKASLLLWQHGPIREFPWLDLTLLSQHVADLHFGFHLFVAPFVAWLGMFDGLRVASVILAALFVAVFDWCVCCLVGADRCVRPGRSADMQIRLADMPEGGHIGPPLHIWTILLLFTQPFLTRLLLAKATPLALIWFFIGLTAAWLRKPWLVAVAACGFALSHAGWIYLAGSVVLLACGELVYRRIVQEETWRTAIRQSLWRELLAGLCGAVLGIVVHPNFPQNIQLSWTQVVTIGLGTPYAHVLLGQEWLPPEMLSFVTSYAPWIIAFVLGLVGLLLAPKKPLDHGRAKLLVSLSPILAVLFALTLKSRRNAEYLVPVVALWCATLWSLVDMAHLRVELLKNIEPLGRMARRLVPWLVIVCFSVLLLREAWGAWTSLHPPTYPDDVYRVSMDAISSRAAPGDRVFHSSWDEFPMLFAADDRLRYISGLDPTFLYVASTTLSDSVRDLTWGQATSTKEQAWSLIHDQLHSRFVFLSKKNHQMFYSLILSDPRYLSIADATDSAAFEIR